MDCEHLRSISEKEVALALKKLNNRPRKWVNYQTPTRCIIRLYVTHFEVEYTASIENCPVVEHCKCQKEGETNARA